MHANHVTYMYVHISEIDHICMYAGALQCIVISTKAVLIQDLANIYYCSN